MTGKKPDPDRKPETPGSGLVGRRGYTHDPLEGASGSTQGDAGQGGTTETRQQSDPTADRT